MQVPNVTLDDLQAFHSKHFPGKPQPTLPQENDEPAEEDLGYYPDGVKRTLTDEQIRIFRHSEIHALLRQKQLQIENAEYEARMASTGDNTPAANSPTEDTKAAPRAADTHAHQRGQRNSKKRVAEDINSEPLDYGDESSDQPPAKRPESRVPYQGRRIISYDD
ncbi:hypothetical protein PENANT_c003G08326 [Penicillium antarcticum]|uniref:Uncharacterized protein n=1 Tax=Penicillium antarcticum TaxID=416450 RepID=A0A1V6QJ04_9EURO|nr:uncharacterized protein N7508_005774 [Penicillium antarcticum]KAJ5306759.1 hypothetical protein N7508_005774 [Penicillium antarcticum]OQD88866.1 hypothetical protein PENANT_c003G08326 [Penicillium antarcticum]